MKKAVAISTARIAAMAAMLVCCKEVIAFIPNVELVSLLVALFAVHFGRDALASIYIFVLLEGLLYGFNPWWWVPYMYVWTLLWLVCTPLKNNEDSLLWAVILGFFGLIFGTLCAGPYFFTGGISAGIAYILSGLGFDLIHAVSNFLVALLLWKPLSKALKRIGSLNGKN